MVPLHHTYGTNFIHTYLQVRGLFCTVWRDVLLINQHVG
jgi:hypothetical protein